MQFKATPVNVNGMSLSAYAEDLDMAILLKRFPEGVMSGYLNEEIGYYSDELGFLAEDGKVYYVYSRFGHVRIGSPEGFSSSGAKELISFLKSSIKD